MEKNETKLERKCCGRLPHVFPMTKDGTDWVVHCSVCWEGSEGVHHTKQAAIDAWERDSKCT